MPFLIPPDVVDKITSAVDDLITLWSIIRRSSPSHVLNGDEEKSFIERLKRASLRLSEALERLDVKESGLEGLESSLSTLSPHTTLILVASPSLRKKLLGMGIPRSRVLAIGGPLTVDDMKKLNPDIPDQAVKGLEARIERFWRDLERRAKEIKDIILLLGEGKRADDMIARRSSIISERTGVNVRVIRLKRFDDLSLKVLLRFFGR
ncbi:MAG: DUF2100 domain-containing protein [Candidatus Freyarchaeota archaeon]